MRVKKVITGIALDRQVVDYLQQLGQKHQRSRSFLVNAIVLEYAKRSPKPFDAPEESLRNR
jgi:hypothetical protein